jgi:hypothetical protein
MQLGENEVKFTDNRAIETDGLLNKRGISTGSSSPLYPLHTQKLLKYLP